MDFEPVKSRYLALVSADSAKLPKKEQVRVGKRKYEAPDQIAPELQPASDSAGRSPSPLNPDVTRSKKRHIGPGAKAPTGALGSVPSALNNISRYESIFGSAELVPGFSKTLNQLRADICERGLPFVFAVSKTRGLKISDKEKVYPWITTYFEAAPSNIPDSDQSLSLHYVLSGEFQIRTFGTFELVSKTTHPLMGYIIRTNDLVLNDRPHRLTELYKAAAVGYLAFKNNISVKKDSKVADAFLASIPAEARKDAFSCVMVEALGSKNLNLASHCIPFSDGLESCDDDGHTALTSALYPQAEDFLKLLIADVPENKLRYLSDARKYAIFAGWTRAADLLEKHAARFGYTLDDSLNEKQT